MRPVICLAAVILPALFMPADLSARGRREVMDPVVQVTGVVRLVGSAMFSDLVITGPEMEWYVDKEEEYKLFDLQQQVVTVEANETVIELTFANGLPAGKRRLLKNIKIIAIEYRED